MASELRSQQSVNAAADTPAPLVNSKGRSGRKRGRSRGKSGSSAENKFTGPPRSQGLSVTSTTERNEAFWFTFHEGKALQAMDSMEFIYSSAEALPIVSSVIHNSLCAMNTNYQRTVPESAMAYYCAIVVWAQC